MTVSTVFFPLLMHSHVIILAGRSIAIRGLHSNFPYGTTPLFVFMRMGRNCQAVSAAIGVGGTVIAILVIGMFHSLFMDFDPRALVVSGALAAFIGALTRSVATQDSTNSH